MDSDLDSDEESDDDEPDSEAEEHYFSAQEEEEDSDPRTKILTVNELEALFLRLAPDLKGSLDIVTSAVSIS